MALTDNILAYWNLNNNGSGGVSLVDSTGNGNALTNNGGVTLGTGIIAGDAVFNTTNYLETTILNPPSTGDVAVSFWMNPTTYGSGSVGDYLGTALSLCYQPNADIGWLFIFNTSGNLRVFNLTQTFETPVIPLGEWTNIIVSRSSGVSDVYVNGQNVGSFADNSDFSQGGTTIGVPIDLIGTGNLQFNGGIDEIGFWNRSLSGSEIDELYNGGFGLTYPFDLLYFSGGNLSSLSNWWQDQGFNIQAAALPDSTSSVVIDENATSGSLVCLEATINNASVAGNITGNCTFTGTSSNSGSITGDVSVYYPAQNPLGGSVSGTISYFWPNGTGIWGGDVWIDGENVLIIPAENEVKEGVVYGFPNDPLTGTYTGEGGGGGNTNIARLLNLPWFVNI
jgi:hypothetical protein